MEALPETTRGFAVLLDIILASLVVLSQQLRVCCTETYNDAVERLISAKSSRNKVQERAETAFTQARRIIKAKILHQSCRQR